VDTTIVGVIDGDGRAPANLIRDVVDAYFSQPEIGGLQCRVRIGNRQRMLGLLQDIEFSCVANASQSIRDLLDSVGMGGNGQFVRLRHLVRHGDSPWSACLVDDLELGLRLHLDGVRIRYSPTAVITQQAIVKLRPLLRQRARWAQGNLQCAQYVHRLLRSRQVGSIGLLDYLAYLVAPWLTVPVSILLLGIVIAAGHTVPQAVALWIGMIFLPGLTWGLWHWWRLRDERLWRCLVAGLCYPFFLLIGTLGTWRGLARHLAGRDEWAKTERLDEPASADMADMAYRH
jgi:1,2-diacylglycerol 3-beta-glucosyltransferase